MSSPFQLRASRASLFFLLAVAAPISAQVDSRMFDDLRWRNIGPLRGGRTRSGSGVPGKPYTFYIGVCNGGVWKTTDAGRTWTPIFDDQPTASIGAIAVAPSNANVLYVGTGEGLQRPDLSIGDGMYRSADGGKTWTHLGLRDAQQIANIAIDPKNPDRLFVAAVGHPYGPNAERGIFRSTDGGKTFESVLKRDENVGGNDVDIDPRDPNIVYATLWESRQGPWENSSWSGVAGGVFKSTDGGTTWHPVGGGLPDSIIQVNLSIAPSNSARLYATVGTTKGVGIYRSDNAGEHWTQITKDTRPASRIGGGDLPVPVVNPQNPDVIVMGSTVAWRSLDGGATWAPLKGAPGGDDYQGAWINPENPEIMLLVSDQGAIVTLNNGDTWSSWYNQSTAQLYHIAADNAFPYRLCSGQQESGSACVASRGNHGAISERDWLPVAIDEYAYAAPDPLDPDIVYGGRSVARFDRRTGQVSGVGPIAGGKNVGGPAGTYRQVRTHPVVFSVANPHALYFGNNFLWKTVDGGAHWDRISPDLTRTSYELPKTIGKYAAPALVIQRGVIYTIAPSPIAANRVWIGTDDGLIHTTTDNGAHWTDVTPPAMGPFWKVFMIDAGRFDAGTAYAAVNTLRLDDMRPHLFRTHDGGKTWKEIVTGMDDAGPANAIREDPKKKGLLFASTERGVYVSLDDGDHWQSLRRNLPASSARDIIVKDDDIAIATHGRGFWILDDIARLRQMDAGTAARDAVLFRPVDALRVRWNTNTDTPVPADETLGENPPEGASIDYYVKEEGGPVTLEIVRPDGRVVRRYSSSDVPPQIPDVGATPVPQLWYRAPRSLSAAAGMHRFYWDVHYDPVTPPAATMGGLPISAIPHNTVPSPSAPWATPGTYTVRLTVNGKTLTQPVTVKQDPRVRTAASAMQEVYTLSDAVYGAAVETQASVATAAALREQIAALKPRASGAALDALSKVETRVAELSGIPATPTPPTSGPAPSPPQGSLTAILAALNGILSSVQSADVALTGNQRVAAAAALQDAKGVKERWKTFESGEFTQANSALKAAGLAELRLK